MMYQINDRVRMTEEQDFHFSSSHATIVWAGDGFVEEDGTPDYLLQFDEPEEWMHDGQGRGDRDAGNAFWFVNEKRLALVEPATPEPEVEPWWLE